MVAFPPGLGVKGMSVSPNSKDLPFGVLCLRMRQGCHKVVHLLAASAGVRGFMPKALSP